MKKGDVLGGFVLTTDPQGGGGQSEWAFARKDGEDLFLKRFLQPAFPVEGGPGSPKTKEYRRRRCEEFERHHRLVMRKLRALSGEGGNLVITRDFFRERAFYYKVTIKVDVSGIGPKEIAALPRGQRIFIMLTAAKSLDTLHKAGLVHGDVKPENLLINALDEGRFAVKVIDFDNCFPVHDPPAADSLVGDPAYYSPELLRYQLGEAAAGRQLDEKNDVFALGLVFWQYLVGTRPKLPGTVTYPAEAIAAGGTLPLPKSVRDAPLAALVQSMLALAADDRPSMSEVHAGLRMARRADPEVKPARPAAEEPEASKLKGTLLRNTDASTRAKNGDVKGTEGVLPERLAALPPRSRAPVAGRAYMAGGRGRPAEINVRTDTVKRTHPSPRRYRKGRRRALVIAALTAVIVASGGTVLAVHPWLHSPVLRPTGLAVQGKTTSSLTIDWSGPATGPRPDKYEILRDGAVIGTVPGTATTYTDSGLAPDSPFHYQVIAVRGGEHSPISVSLSGHTSAPPMSDARLDWSGSVTYTMKSLSPPASSWDKQPGSSWQDQWSLTPKCSSGPCDATLQGSYDSWSFTSTLTRSGTTYEGTAEITNDFYCTTQSNYVSATLTITITAKSAFTQGTQWVAKSFSGTATLYVPAKYGCSDDTAQLAVKSG
jgi:eukaryotic-like serine/threonine-protein kinase